MNEEEDTRPHEIFSNELITEQILSFMDPADLLNARLVCKDWNDKILKKFHRKLAFQVRSEDVFLPDGALPNIEEVDQRILTSVRCSELDDGQDVMDMFECGVTDKLLNGVRGGKLKKLKLQWINENSLDYFIKVFNSGALRNLENLCIGVQVSQFEREQNESEEEAQHYARGYRCVGKMRQGCLPNLKHLTLLTRFCTGEDETDVARLEFLTGQLPATFASFLIASQKITSLKLTFPSLDLSGTKNLKMLRIKDKEGFFTQPQEVIDMLTTCSRLPLKSLELKGVQFSFNDLPTLPNLKTIRVPSSSLPASEMPLTLNWSHLPSISMLEIQLDKHNNELELARINWTAIAEVIPASVRALQISNVTASRNMMKELEPILNLDVRRLVIEMTPYSELTALLDLDPFHFLNVVIMERQKIRGTVQRMLEFNCISSERGHDERIHSHPFSSFLKELGMNWDIIWFCDVFYKFKWINIPSDGENEEIVQTVIRYDD